MRRFLLFVLLASLVAACTTDYQIVPVKRRHAPGDPDRTARRTPSNSWEVAATTYKPPESAQSVQYICHAVRTAISGREIDSETFYKNAPKELKEPYTGFVFLSVYGKKARLFKSAARAENAARGSLAALAALQKQVSGKLPADTDKLAVKVDFTKTEFPLERSETAQSAFLPGIDGLLLDLPQSRKNLKLSEFRLPAEILTRAPATRADIMLYFYMLEGSGTRRRFRTKAFLQTKAGEHPVALTRSLPPGPPATARVLKERIVGACDYLMRNQRKDGSYPYLYAANRDRFPDAPKESAVRQVATASMMILAGEALSRDDFISSAERHLDYMRRQLKRKNKMAYFLHQGEATLGGSAILAWTLCNYRRVTGKAKYDQLAREAVDFVMFLQKQDGSFHNFYKPELEAPINKASRYYPGEACLALYWFHKVYGGREYLDAALRGATALSRRLNEQLSRGTNVVDAWLMQSVRFLYPHAGEKQKEQMLAAVERMSNVMVRAQRTEETTGQPDLAGSFRSAAPVLPGGPGGAALCEGLAATYFLLKSLGKPAETIRNTLLNAAAFQLKHQYWDANMYFLPNPGRARGGISGTLIDCLVRVDHVQHTVVLFLELLKILNE